MILKDFIKKFSKGGEMEFKVGDRVKILGDKGGLEHCFEVGDIGEIIDEISPGRNYNVKLANGQSRWVSPKDLEKIGKEETTKFKKGDRVKVINNEGDIENKYVGKVGKIIIVDEGITFPYSVEFKGDLNNEDFNDSELEGVLGMGNPSIFSSTCVVSGPGPTLSLSKFKIGDKVKILWGKTGYLTLDSYKGSGEIIESKPFSGEWEVGKFHKKDDIGYSLRFKENQLERISEKKGGIMNLLK